MTTESSRDLTRVADVHHSILMKGLGEAAMKMGKGILPEDTTANQVREFFPTRPIYLGTGWEFSKDFPVGNEGEAVQTGVQIGISQLPSIGTHTTDFHVNVIIFGQTGQISSGSGNSFVGVVFKEKISPEDVSNAQKVKGIFEEAVTIAQEAYNKDLPILPGYLMAPRSEGINAHLMHLLSSRQRYRAGLRERASQT